MLIVHTASVFSAARHAAGWRLAAGHCRQCVRTSVFPLGLDMVCALVFGPAGKPIKSPAQIYIHTTESGVGSWLNWTAQQALADCLCQCPHLECFRLSGLCIFDDGLALSRENVQPLLFVDMAMVLCRVVARPDRHQVHLHGSTGVVSQSVSLE